MIDLSRGGLQVHHPGVPDCEPEQTMMVSLVSEHADLTLRCRVAWVEVLDSRESVMGLQVIELDEANRLALDHLIEMTCSGYDAPWCYRAA